jgi:hypothetical protein
MLRDSPIAGITPTLVRAWHAKLGKVGQPTVRLRTGVVRSEVWRTDRTAPQGHQPRQARDPRAA